MLTLSLLRHAKSSWSDPLQDDFDRPLNERGRAAAPVAGRAVGTFSQNPGLILCSTAARTRETLDAVMDELPLDPQRRLKMDARLYLASPLSMLEILREQDEQESRSALLIGHNPGIHELAMQLASMGDDKALTALSNNFPTAALAVISLDCQNWKDVRPGCGRLLNFWTPRGGALPLAEGGQKG